MLQHIRAYLLDLDGVVYRGEQRLPGAREFVEWIDATGRQALYLSNNSLATPAEVTERLARLGMPRPQGRVLTAGWAAVRAIAARHPGGSVYVLGMPSVERMVEMVGLRPIWREEHGPDRDSIPDALLVGLDRTLTYARLRQAMRALAGGATFFAVNRDPRLPVEDGFEPGTGAITAALEYASGQHPIVIGKPMPGIVLEAMRMLGVGPAETLMVGDGLDLDIVAGHAAHVTTALVLSGLNDASQAAAATGERRPDLIYADLADLLAAAQAAAR